MTLEAGQLYIPGSASEIRDDLLADYRLEAAKYQVDGSLATVAPGTDNYRFFTAVANAGLLQYGNISTIRPAITPLNATGDDLENWRIALGLPVVQDSPAAGKITVTVSGGGDVTFPDGQQFLLPNGFRGKVSGTQPGIADQDDVNVVLIDSGSDGNAESGTQVRWVNPPFNVATVAVVSVNGPLDGGFDEETEARKRDRVLNRLQNTPSGGNWGHLREIAFDALPSVQLPFVYPALGGPSSDKLIVLKAFDRKRSDYHRAMQQGAVQIVRDAVHAELSTGDEHVIGTGNEEPCDITLALSLPASSLSGGNGLGWIDQRPWPPAGSGDHVTVVSTSDALNVTVSAATATAPIAGQTHITWWAPGDMKPRTSLVIAVSGSSGAWSCQLDQPFVDDFGNAVAAGDFISPAAAGIEKYGSTFLDLMEVLGAGENTTDVNRLPRSARHPFIGDGPDIGITNTFATKFLRANPEIVDGELSYLPTPTPSVPGSVSANPNVLTPRHFGIVVMT